MIKYICDRCGKDIDENYYTCAFGCMSNREGTITVAGGALNMEENMRQNRMLCYECINEIRDFVDKKKDYIDGRKDYDRRRTKEDIGKSSKRNYNSVFRWKH